MFFVKQLFRTLITPIVAAVLLLFAGSGIAGSTVPLVAGQHFNIGEVIIDDVDPLSVQITYRITASDYWCLQYVHADIQATYADLPMTKKHNPKVGHFPINEAVDCESEATFDLGPMPDSSYYVVAAHAEVDNTPYCLTFDPLCSVYVEETAWGVGIPFEGDSWAAYIEVLPQCVNPEYDMVLESLSIPAEVGYGRTVELSAQACNIDADGCPTPADGFIVLTGVSDSGVTYEFSSLFESLEPGVCHTAEDWNWPTPTSGPAEVNWTAVVVAPFDINPSNNTDEAVTTVDELVVEADLVLDELSVPSVVRSGDNRTEEVAVNVCNAYGGSASGTVDLVGVSRVVYLPPITDATFSGGVIELPSGECQTVAFIWYVDDRGTTMDWTATVTPYPGITDTNLDNNTATDSTLVYAAR